MGPYQRTPKEVARAIRYSGLGVRSVGPVGDFLEYRFRGGSGAASEPRVPGQVPGQGSGKVPGFRSRRFWGKF